MAQGARTQRRHADGEVSRADGVRYGVHRGRFRPTRLGWLLIRVPRSGWPLTFGMQVFQIPVLAIRSFRHSFSAGPYFVLGKGLGRWDFDAGAKATLQVGWAGQTVMPYVGLNVVPIILLVPIAFDYHRERVRMARAVVSPSFLREWSGVGWSPAGT